MLESYRNYLSVIATARLDRKLRGRLSPSDVVQETMLQAYRDFEQFRGASERELMGWLRSILSHTLARIIETHVLAKRRDVRRDVSIAKIAAGIEHSTMQLNLGLVARGRSPASLRAVGCITRLLEGVFPSRIGVLSKPTPLKIAKRSSCNRIVHPASV